MLVFALACPLPAPALAGPYNPAKLAEAPAEAPKKDAKSDKKGGDGKDGKGKQGGAGGDKGGGAAAHTEDGPPSVSPRHLFTAALEAIWGELLSSALGTGALLDPSESDHPLNDVNSRINSNLRYQRR